MGASADSTQGARPLRADARRNRERVVAAAHKVFEQHGSVAQIDLIAREAGVGVGTVYRHFPTKDALVGELFREKFAAMERRVRRWLDVEDPWAAFEGMIRESVEEAKVDAVQQRLMWEAPQAAFEAAADALAALQAAGGELVARAQAAGELREDFTSPDIGTFMCGVGGVLSVAQRGGHHDVDRLVEVWLRGVRARER
jgi:AcrR family transcriptional regulator